MIKNLKHLPSLRKNRIPLAFLFSTLAHPVLCFACTSPNLPQTVTRSTLVIPSNLPIGSTIPGTKQQFSVIVNGNCSNYGIGRWYVSNFATKYNLVPGYADVYTTPLMGGGVGFRMRNASGVALKTVRDLYANDSFDLAPTHPGQNTVSGSIEFVRVGKIEAGQFSVQGALHLPRGDWANTNEALSRLVTNYSVSSLTPTCSTTTPNATVSLQTIRTSQLRADGMVAGSTPFSIGLSCENDAKPDIHLTDVTTPSNTSDRLTLTPTSTARRAPRAVCRLMKLAAATARIRAVTAARP